MKTIKLRSKKNLFFPPFYNGVVEMKILNVVIDYTEKRYVLSIEDSCYKKDEESEVRELLGTPTYRTSYQTFDSVEQLHTVLKSFISKKNIFEGMDILLGQGLYYTTKKEIEEDNLKWYGCESIEDWELVIE